MSNFPDSPLLIQCPCTPPDKFGSFSLMGILHQSSFAGVWVKCNACSKDFSLNATLSPELTIGRIKEDGSYKETSVKLGDLSLPGIVSMAGKIKHALT